MPEISELSKILPVTIVFGSNSSDKYGQYLKLLSLMGCQFVSAGDFFSVPNTSEEKNQCAENSEEKAQAFVPKMQQFLAANSEKFEGQKVFAFVEDSSMEASLDFKKIKEVFKVAIDPELESHLTNKFRWEYYNCLFQVSEPAQHEDEKAAHFKNSELEKKRWMFEADPYLEQAFPTIPGPNLKPQLEMFPNGFFGMMEALYISLEKTLLEVLKIEDAAKIKDGRFILYKNEVVGNFYDMSLSELKPLKIEAKDSGAIISAEEFKKLTQDASKDPKGIFFADVLFPDIEEESKPTRQSKFSRSQLLASDHYPLGSEEFSEQRLPNYMDFRRSLIKQFTETHSIKPISYANHIEVHLAKEKLPSKVWVFPDQGKIILKESEHSILLAKEDPIDEKIEQGQAHLMSEGDIFIFSPLDSKTPLNDKLQLFLKLLTAVVDKQTLPYAKGKKIMVINEDAFFDPVLNMINWLRNTGIKNSYGEIDCVLEDKSLLQEKLQELSDAVSHEKIKKGLKQESSEIPPREMQEVTKDRVSVFVAGGNSNANASYVLAASNVGEAIAKMDCDLVTGAGDNGVMKAVCLGYFQEALKTKLSSHKDEILEILTKGLDEDPSKDFADIIKWIKEGDESSLAKANFEKFLDPKSLKELSRLVIGGNMVGCTLPELAGSEGDSPFGETSYVSNYQQRLKRLNNSDICVYLTGGQGTMQELMDKVLSQKNDGIGIIVLNQLSDTETPVYNKEFLNFLNQCLAEKGCKELEVFDNEESLVSRLEELMKEKKSPSTSVSISVTEGLQRKDCKPKQM